MYTRHMEKSIAPSRFVLQSANVSMIRPPLCGIKGHMCPKVVQEMFCNHKHKFYEQCCRNSFFEGQRKNTQFWAKIVRQTTLGITR